MNEVRFAADMRTPAQLATLLQSPCKPGDSRWLVIDAALLSPPPLLLQRWHSLGEHFNALEDSRLARFGDAAPSVLKVSEDASATIVRTLAVMHGNAPQATAVSMICSAASAHELKRLFAYLACPQLDDDLSAHCRFADTRVLPQLLQHLTAEQSAHCAAVMSGWHWLDRRGACETWLPAPDAQPVLLLPDAVLRLRVAQYGAMLDAAEPDTLFAALAGTVPELVPDDAGAAFHDKLQRILAQASRLMVTQPADRQQFVVLGLSLGEEFHRHRDLATTWQAVAAGASFSAQMQLWSDSLWGDLEAAARSSTAP